MDPSAAQRSRSRYFRLGELPSSGKHRNLARATQTEHVTGAAFLVRHHLRSKHRGRARYTDVTDQKRGDSSPAGPREGRASLPPYDPHFSHSCSRARPSGSRGILKIDDSLSGPARRPRNLNAEGGIPAELAGRFSQSCALKCASTRFHIAQTQSQQRPSPCKYTMAALTC